MDGVDQAADVDPLAEVLGEPRLPGDYAGRRRRGTDGLARAALAASLSE